MLFDRVKVAEIPSFFTLRSRFEKNFKQFNEETFHSGNFWFELLISHLLSHISNESKLFQLVAEFMRLGAIVIHADFSRLIICTKKSRVGDALAYIDYVTHSIKNKELFHSIDIKVTQTWECLMWLDPVRCCSLHSEYAFQLQIFDLYLLYILGKLRRR